MATPAPSSPTPKALARAAATLHKACRTGVLQTIAANLAPSGDTSLTAALLAATDDDGNGALHWAAKNGHDNAIFFLITQGADPSSRNNRGETAKDIQLAASDRELGSSERFILYRQRLTSMERDHKHSKVEAAERAASVAQAEAERAKEEAEAEKNRERAEARLAAELEKAEIAADPGESEATRNGGAGARRDFYISASAASFGSLPSPTGGGGGGDATLRRPPTAATSRHLSPNNRPNNSPCPEPLLAALAVGPRSAAARGGPAQAAGEDAASQHVQGRAEGAGAGRGQGARARAGARPAAAAAEALPAALDRAGAGAQLSVRRVRAARRGQADARVEPQDAGSRRAVDRAGRRVRSGPAAQEHGGR